MEREHHELELLPEQLRKVTNPTSLGFATTTDLVPLTAEERMVGQERAAEAIEFALEIDDPRYNLFVAGEPGTGRQTAALAMVRGVASQRHPKNDWCYVYHFEQPAEPHALALPAGKARTFVRDVDGFVLASRRELRRAFTDDAYTKRRDDLLRVVDAEHTALLDQLQQEALALGFLLQGTPSGLQILPAKMPEPASEPATPLVATTDENNGKSNTPAPEHPEPQAPAEPQPLTREEFDALPQEEQQRLRANHDLVQAAVNRMLPQIRELEEDARTQVRRLDRDVAHTAIGHLAETLLSAYTEHQAIVDYLGAMKADIIAHADVLGKPPEESASDEAAAPDHDILPAANDEVEELSEDKPLGISESGEGDTAQGGGVPLDEDLRVRPNLTALLRRYKVNALVTHTDGEPAPIVQEMNPTYTNLMGRIEYGVRDGLPYTDHLMIRPGALHRANGGFIIMQASDVLGQSRSWDAVKRMLRFGIIAAESASESQGMPPSASLRPEPIPAQLKVVLIGDTETYALLLNRDVEFHHLFKVRADFDSEMTRNPAIEGFYGRFAGDVARLAERPALTSAAVALVIEEGSRWVEDQERLSTQLGNLSDLVVEACYWGKKDGSALTDRVHVQRAIESRQRRLGLLADKLDHMIFQGTTLIDTSNAVVGQVNGLTVIHQGNHAFGKPVRITARTSPGWSGVVNLEREIGTSGPSHSKGVLILSGYLAGRFAQDYPLALAASLCFEQLYDEVDGDSASSAEMYALLSSLAGIEIKQALAVTGSVNQRGEIQAVGGVVHKIEAFFHICQERGLTKEQGVIIPQSNVQSLMLREDVVEAVRAGLFHIYAIHTIDEGIELLTGIPAGKPDREGRYLEGTINARILRTLKSYSERVRAFGLPMRP